MHFHDGSDYKVTGLRFKVRFVAHFGEGILMIKQTLLLTELFRGTKSYECLSAVINDTCVK